LAAPTAGEKTPPDAHMREDLRAHPDIVRTHPDIARIHTGIARIHTGKEKNHRGARTIERLLTGRDALMRATPTRRGIGDARR
jgi:hypothetical protein